MGFSHLSVEKLLKPEGFDCSCGKHHSTALRYLEIGKNAVNKLIDILNKCQVTKPYIVFDKNTFKAAGEKLVEQLDEAKISYVTYVFPQEEIEPDEFAVGQVIMSFDPSCDFIIAVGSGVINDVCRIAAKATGRDYAVVGTAPSMDGFASNSSSMIWNGIKTTIYAVCPVAIIADTDIMRMAPMIMLQAGLGDMIAKYVSICEWRISNLVTNEYYCPEIAQLMRNALRKCIENASQLKERDELAVAGVVEGLILSGIAMSFAQVSRPASGLEHYFSHMFDMFTLEKGAPGSLHGIQVGIGTLLTLSIYEKLKAIDPDRQEAMDKVGAFDYAAWENNMHRIFGKTSNAIINLEAKYQKNDKVKHQERLECIIANWDNIKAIMNEELPSFDDIYNLLDGIDAPIHPRDIGINDDEVYDALIGSREIRDKYIGSSLLWDLGLLERYAQELVGR